MIAYHVVTDRPMELGQVILFEEAHHSGVYRRVMDQMERVREVYAHPEHYQGVAVDHHLAVALRELALEEVRRERYPQYPSRMACLYVSETLREAEDWGKFFAEIGRPTYSIVKLEIEGDCFAGTPPSALTAPPTGRKTGGWRRSIGRTTQITAPRGGPSKKCWWTGASP